MSWFFLALALTIAVAVWRWRPEPCHRCDRPLGFRAWEWRTRLYHARCWDLDVAEQQVVHAALRVVAPHMWLLEGNDWAAARREIEGGR